MGAADVDMEFYEVKRPIGPTNWTVEVPGSKSITNRALLMSALSSGSVTLRGVQFSDDCRVFLEALKTLGFGLSVSEDERQVTVAGCNGKIPLSSGDIYVGSAGTAARFLTAMLGFSAGTYRVSASPQMEKRPMKPLFLALQRLGTSFAWPNDSVGYGRWYLPVEITGCRAIGGVKNDTEINFSESTQFLSALLLTGPMAENGLRIKVTGEKKDGPYINITRRMMEEFGVKTEFSNGEYLIPGESVYNRTVYEIEPDISAACYFYAAAAVTGGYAKVNGVHRNGMQGDLRFLTVLEDMGCTVKDEPDGVSVIGPDPGGLHGVSVDMRDFSDQALTLAAIAPYADGPVEIRNVAHIRKQESDRIHAIAENLGRAGIACDQTADGAIIHPGKPQACHIETFEDHRVAMAFAVMGLGTDGIVIENPGCCAKTFKEYFDVLNALTDVEEDC
ncbi:MAG: 3-phosphoshikimate 1-carboxyvinyltransferase [Clostridiales bacterium]|nr:3-phosphoshikimate 1-carboxyvinyltransferase [Clostridiales bacterium]